MKEDKKYHGIKRSYGQSVMNHSELCVVFQFYRSFVCNIMQLTVEMNFPTGFYSLIQWLCGKISSYGLLNNTYVFSGLHSSSFM